MAHCCAEGERLRAAVDAAYYITLRNRIATDGPADAYRAALRALDAHRATHWALCNALAWTEAERQVRCRLPLDHEGEHEEPSTHGVDP